MNNKKSNQAKGILIYTDDKKNRRLVVLKSTEPQIHIFLEDYAEIMDAFVYYQEWMLEQKERLNPNFEEIKNEINAWLVKSYSINPSPNSFMQWFFEKNFGLVDSNIEFNEDKESGRAGFINVTIPDAWDEEAPNIIERDLHEYCIWKAERQKAYKKAIIEANNKKQGKSDFTWQSIFKNSDHAQIILDKISEFLNDKGEWNIEPKGQYITALYLDLKDKGYLINGNALTNPKAMAVFNNQFKTDLDEKAFQPQRSSNAQSYREHFRMIPTLNKK